MVAAFNTKLDEEYEAAKSHRPNHADWLDGRWTGFERAPEGDRRGGCSQGPLGDETPHNSRLRRSQEGETGRCGGALQWAVARGPSWKQAINLVAHGSAPARAHQTVGSCTISRTPGRFAAVRGSPACR